MIDLINIATILKKRLLNVSEEIKGKLVNQSKNFGIGITENDITENHIEFTLETSVYSLTEKQKEEDDEGLLISPALVRGTRNKNG